MPAYYNENDPYCAEWLRNLIAAGHIAPGDVDDRSIEEVSPDDLKGYEQCHFFAGIGGWSYALRLAGWPDDRLVWSGSCPCQPFSAAGKQEGTTDARHLWPEWLRLIRERRPRVVFGEQVSAAIRHGWLDLVSADLEGLDYSVGAAVMGAHSVGAPHIRQRLYFVADSGGIEHGRLSDSERNQVPAPWSGGAVCELADSERGAAERRGHYVHAASGGIEGKARERQRVRVESRSSSDARELADSDGRDASAEGLQRSGEHGLEPQDGGAGAVKLAQPDSVQSKQPAGLRARPEETTGAGAHSQPSGRGDASFWSSCDWLPCIDGKARPVEPGTFPLAHGAPARVGRLRAYGNAIVPQQAAEFIRAHLDVSGL